MKNSWAKSVDAVANTNTAELSAYNRGLNDEAERDFTYGITEHFNVTKIDALTCKTNIFTEVELTFLSNWLKLKEQKIQFCVENTSGYLKSCTDLLPDYSMDENEENIRCISELEVRKVVNLIKLLFRSLSLCEAREINKKLAEKLRSSFEICRKESENFIREIAENNLQFEDTFGLEMFLEASKNKKIFVLKCAEQSVLEMSRILSVLKRLNLNSYMFLNWEQIVRLNHLIYLEKTFNSEVDLILIVLDCQNCSKKMIENEENILKSLIENLRCKLILVVNSKSQILDSIQAEKMVVESLFKFSHFLPDSQNLLSQKNIIFNDANYTLNELIDEESKENLSLKTIQILCKNNVNIGKFNLNSSNNFNISIQLNEKINCNNFLDSLEEDADFIILISSSNVKSSLTDELLEMFNEEQMKTVIGLEVEKKVKICLEKDENRILETFNNLCKTSKNNSKIFWLELIPPHFILKQIYHRDLYTPMPLHKNTKLSNKVFEFLAANDKTSRLIILGNCIEEPLNPKEKDADRNEFSKYFDLDSVLSKSTQKQFLRKMNKTIFCYPENEVETQFNHLVKSNSDKCIHWLNLFSKAEVHWHKSHGSVQDLTRYFDERFVIICDEPGMGKSTSLSKFGEELAESGWVINLDLASHQPELQALTLRNFEDILTLMVENMELEPKDLFTKILFCSLKNSNFHKIIFLFDGFDELNKDGRKTMLSILKILKEESLANIWITTRPDQKKVLEDCLSVVSSRFIKFDKGKQIEYLIKFWKSCLHFHRYNARLLVIYANEVLDEAESILGAEIPAFLGNPLHIRMVAEVVWPLLKRRISANCESLELNHNFKIHNFFQEFVKIKYESYEKRQNLQRCDNFVRYSVSSTLRKHFRKLAVQMLFPFQARHHFGIHSSRKEDELIAGLTRVGLVQQLSTNRQHQFIYRILAEYFVADFLFYWLKKFRNQHGNYAAATNFVIGTVLLEKEHRTIREFINYTLLIDFEIYKDIICID